MLRFIDCHVRMEQPQTLRPIADCLGVVFYGAATGSLGLPADVSGDGVLWRHAESLDRIVGESHARFPSRASAVIDLQLGPRLLDALAKPAEWWPLCYPLRGTSRLIRLSLPPGAHLVAKVKQVLRRHPETFFLFDPFVHGPVEGWQAQVRMAEWANVFITTLGLSPSLCKGWREEEIGQALHFVVGEVGAARLLYASGGDWAALGERDDVAFREWMAGQPVFDSREVELVFSENAWRLLHSEERL